MVLYKKMERNMENGAVYDHRESRPRRIDVTGTQAYRELYANNLRMYGFLMKKELDRKKHENLRNHKEEYFQNHLSLENNQRNSRLLKSFRQMSRMRTCLSDLDLSKTSDSEPEFVKPYLPFSKNSLFESNFKGKDKNHNLTVRPRSWTARDKQSQSPVLFKGRRSSDFATTNSKFLSVPTFDRSPSPLTSPDSSSAQPPVLLVSPTRQTYVPGFRRHVSDLGVSRDVDSNASSDSDMTYSDSELQSHDVNGNSDTERKGSPSLQRARQARKRHEYRKARIASLENEILKADSVLRNLKKIPNSLADSIPEN